MKNLMFAIAICLMATITSCNSNNNSQPNNVECFQISWEVSDTEDDAIVKIYDHEELVDCVAYNYGYYIAMGPVDDYRLEKETNHGIDTLSYTCELYGILVDEDVMIVLSIDTTEITTPNYDSIKYYVIYNMWSTGEEDSVIQISEPGEFYVISGVNVVEYYHDSTNGIYTKEYSMEPAEFFKTW